MKDLFVAIVSRIAHGDSLQEVTLQSSAPKLQRKISLLAVLVPKVEPLDWAAHR